MILSEGYKNEYVKIMQLIEKIKAWRRNPFSKNAQDEYKNELYEAFEYLFYMCGNGGMPSDQGDHPVNQKTFSKDKPILVIPTGQDMNSDKNASLIKLFEEQEPFAIYINIDRFEDGAMKDESKVMDGDKQCMFLGYFHVEHWGRYKEEKEKMLASLHDGCSAKFRKLSFFRTAKYLRLNVASLFDTSDWRFLCHNSDIRKFHRLEIPKDEDKSMFVSVPISKINEGGITDEDVCSQYIDEGQHLKFQSSDSAASSRQLKLPSQFVVHDYDKDSNTKATIEDIARVACVNQYAGALRYLGGSVFDDFTKIVMTEEEDDEEYEKYLRTDSLTGVNFDFFKSGCTAVPLYGENANWLTQGTIRNPTPMSNRGLDKNVQFVIEDRERQGFERPEGGMFPLKHATGVDFDESHYQTILESMFGICIFRVLGRKQAFKQFGRYCKLDSYLPKSANLEAFLDFMQRTVNGSKSKSMSAWISRQHQKSIPAEWHKWVHFETFARHLSKKLPIALKQFYEENKSGRDARGFSNHWVLARDMLAGVLASLSSSRDQEELRWLAQAIIGDISEQFSMPFGPCMAGDVVEAYGSKSCTHYLRNNSLYTSKESGVADSLQAIINYFHDPKKVPNEALSVLGYWRDPKTKVLISGKSFDAIRNCVNGRLFDAMDAEQQKCKFYLHIKFTAPNYQKSLKPKSSALQCWPDRFRQWDCDRVTKTEKQCKQLMQESVRLFRDVRSRKIDDGITAAVAKLLSMPPVVVLPGEVIHGENNVVENQNKDGAAANDEHADCASNN